MDRLLNVVTGMSVLLIGLVFFAIRRAHIRVEYSVSWLGAALVLLILAQWEWALGQVAEFLGVNNAPFALLLIILSLFLIVFYRFSLIISDLKDANIALTQKLAIIEYQLQHVQEKQPPSGNA
ncbi:MAG: DUF2304 domain-containing protein [Acidobacteriaceae bacterium]|jgi:hypothetical protein|nr:DUF2304 domain-containing protein [Acidobacteriaceae bacterium]